MPYSKTIVTTLWLGSARLSPIPVGSMPIQGKAGSELSGKYSAQRGNQITIRFKNIIFADPSKTPLKDAKAIQEILDVLKDPKNTNSIIFVR
jgi:hypothetical protein